MKNPGNSGFNLRWLTAACILVLLATQFLFIGVYFSGDSTFVQPSPKVPAALFPTNYSVLSGGGRGVKNRQWHIKDLWEVRTKIEDGTGAGCCVRGHGEG